MQKTASNSHQPSNKSAKSCRVVRNWKKSGIDCKNQLSLNSQLLKDLVKIIKIRKGPYIRTRDLIAGLCSDPLKPWATYYRDSNITARHLSALLKPYGLSSCCIYYKEGNAKGYLKKAITEAYHHQAA